MKRILLSLVIFISFFLVGCINETTMYTSTEYINPDMIVEFAFDMIEENANDYDPIKLTYYIDSVYTITEVKILVSEFKSTPYEWEYHDYPAHFTDSLKSIFNNIRTDVTYQNQYLERTVGYPGQITFTLTDSYNEENVIVIDMYHFELDESNESSLRLSFYHDSTLYFYYQFSDFTNKIEDILQYILLTQET